MAEYANDTYLQSLATARGSIDRQVSNTLAEVARQKQLGQAQSTLIPGAVAGTNEAAKGVAGGGTQAMMGSLEKYGLSHPDLGMRQSVEQGHGDILGRLGTIQGAWGRAAPLIGQGFEERGAQQQGRVSLIGQQLHADNDLARSNYVAGRESEDRSRIAQQQQSEAANQIALESLAQQAQLERERIAATANEGALNRGAQSEQMLLDLLHAGFLINPVTGALEPAPMGPLAGDDVRQPTSQPTAPRIGSPRNRN